MSQGVVLLSGGDRLGLAIERLLREAGADVRAFPLRRELARGILQTELDSASVLVLADGDDAGYVDAALTIRRLHLPLIVRLSDGALATYLKATLDRVAILSMSTITAPAFVRSVDH